MGFLHLILAVTISWNCVTTDIDGNPEVIDFYCVFWGQTSQPVEYENHVCAQFSGCYWTLAEDNFLFNTPYYFSVTATDLAGNESDYSNEAIYLREQPYPIGSKHPRRMIHITQKKK